MAGQSQDKTAGQRGFGTRCRGLATVILRGVSDSYYVGDQKVELNRAHDYVAVDEKAAYGAGLDAEVATASKEAERHGGGVVVVPRVALDEQTLASLSGAGALQPVYRHDDAVIVALPEVRVEFDSAEQRRAVLNVLTESAALPNDVCQSADDYLTVRPASGSGVDAIKIANEIHERGHVGDASVRFIQFVPRRTGGRSEPR
jgi:hypothetical protein